MKLLIHLIAAARPNFMKIAPLYHALKKEAWAEPLIVHTGQHYDLNMSDAFFRDLDLPTPHFDLGVGSGTHAEQTGRVMIAYEKLLMESRPDLVVVVGDVNSTLACTLAATKVVFPPRYELRAMSHELGHRPILAHLEAGLRSFDRTMPEEINRIVTDSLVDILWTPSQDGDENLLREGIPAEKIERVGNIMIDSLEMMRPRIEKQKASQKYEVEPGTYGLVTLHRPSNVDSPENLDRLCDALGSISEKIPLIFPVHPRTRKNLEGNGFMDRLNRAKGLHLDEPVSYIPFMNLVFNCRLAITDSGGIQEETTYLGIPCLTLRSNTERPVTVTQGTNRLVRLGELHMAVSAVLEDGRRQRTSPELWDGRTAERVVDSIRSFLATR
jgi:UDP-N-acetylglucosamine 2-epimerase (non-hydrolysing)